MSTNNYNFCPTMTGDDTTVLNYENDDMRVTITQRPDGKFAVDSWSFDGQLEVYETFFSVSAAKNLFYHIKEHYAFSVPDIKALSKFIVNAHNSDIETREALKALKMKPARKSKRYKRLYKMDMAYKNKASRDYAYMCALDNCLKRGYDLHFVV